MLPDLVRRGRTPQVGITASKATISLRITAEGPTSAACEALIEPTAKTIYECLGTLVFGEGDQQLQDVVVRLLRERGQSLATLDCDTQGTLSGWLSEADADREVYRGGMILRGGGCVPAVIGAAGDWPASEPWTAVQARHAAERCRAQFGSDYALAIGPFPNSVDTSATASDVHIALAGPDGTITKATPYAGHPDIVVARIVKSALNYLRLNIAELPLMP
jgi:nicotinamide-nucleotide amidase